MTDKRICPECGAENPEEAEFCQDCGAPLTDAETPDFIDPQQTSHDDLDLLQEAEDDLPGLLHALKQDEEEQDHLLDEEIQEEDLSPEAPEEIFELEEPEGDDDVPEWLDRIRQRASEEDDSIGEITQKIAAARQSLAEDGSSSQRENFEAWLQKLRGQTGGIVADKAEADSEEEAEGQAQRAQGEKEPDWLIKIRQAQGKPGLGAEQDESDSLNWLDALVTPEEEISEDRDDSEGGKPETLDEDADQVELDDASITQEILLGKTSPEVPIPPKLSVTEDEQAQAEAFTSMVLDEKAPRPIRKLKGPSKLGAARFFFALLLIISLSLSLFVVKFDSVQLPPKQSYAIGLVDWVNSLPNGASLLFIFDYQPAWSSEINLMAEPLLEALVDREVEVDLLSSSASGSVLSKQLFEDVAGTGALNITDSGYFPIGAYGAFRLGMASPGNLRITGVPESAKTLPAEEVDGILILSDSYQGARSWIEQLSTLMPEIPINLVVTSGAAPMLTPYFESGQIVGMIAGLDDATIMEAEFSNSKTMAGRWGAYRAGLLILMSVMVIGAIFAGNQHKEEGEAA